MGEIIHLPQYLYMPGGPCHTYDQSGPLLWRYIGQLVQLLLVYAFPLVIQEVKDSGKGDYG